MTPAYKIAITACGTYFIVGLLTGVWKYRKIMASPDAAAPVYVDVAHRAALLYSFACLLIAEFTKWTGFSDELNSALVAVQVIYFGLAMLPYIVHGWLNDTDNQLKPPFRLGKRELPGWLISSFMVTLVIAELGGFAVMFAGFVRTQF